MASGNNAPPPPPRRPRFREQHPPVLLHPRYQAAPSTEAEDHREVGAEGKKATEEETTPVKDEAKKKKDHEEREEKTGGDRTRAKEYAEGGNATWRGSKGCGAQHRGVWRILRFVRGRR